jgi:ubiquinone/menaquinone biosynthesis C-methylase UbiE
VTGPDNPFAATDVGLLYARGRPYHHPRSLARVRALVGAVDVQRALDVACGTGMSTIALAEHAGRAVGLDASVAMLRAAARIDGVDYALANAERLPFPDGAFDAVTCCSGIHWFDQTRFFAELRRVLRPGGWVGLYDHYFIGMDDTPEFRSWAKTLFERYPLPPRNPQVGDPRAETPAGFDHVATETFDDLIEMTRDEFADYQMSVSHIVAAAERGTPLAELRAWLLESTAPLFDGVVARTVRFLGSVTCLRRSQPA